MTSVTLFAPVRRMCTPRLPKIFGMSDGIIEFWLVLLVSMGAVLGYPELILRLL